MRAVSLSLAVLLVTLIGCRSESAPSETLAAPPGERQIARDLVGARFVFFEDEGGPKEWAIEEGEVRDVRVLDGTTSDDGRTHRTRLRVRLAAPNRAIRGELFATYRREGDHWRFEEAARAGPNWAVEELAAVLYAVWPAPPADSTAEPRDVRIEPMFRWAEGRYSAPLAPFEARMRAYFDSTFASDSLAEAERTGIEGAIAHRYLRPSWTLFLLSPGEPPAPAHAREPNVGFDGCQYATATARAPSAAFAGGTWLATTSSTMGGDTVRARPLSSEEDRALGRLARERLARQGVSVDRLGRLQPGRTVASDLDGDGIAEWAGAFAVEGDARGEPPVAVVLAAAPSRTGRPRLVVEHVATVDEEGYGSLDLVGVVDVDGDGDGELILREAGYEHHTYLVLARDASGAWGEVFRGGGGGC